MSGLGREPFQFWGCTEIRESLGIRADSERQLTELAGRMEEVDPFVASLDGVRTQLLTALDRELER